MIWRMLLRSVVSRTWSLARVNAGKRSAARMAIIAMTTNSSIKVKAMAIRASMLLLGFMINKHIGASRYVNVAGRGAIAFAVGSRFRRALISLAVNQGSTESRPTRFMGR